MRAVLKLCVLPPGSSFLLILVGWALARRARRLGRGLIVFALVLLYVESTPLVATLALRSLESDPPITSADARSVDALVVLGADHETHAIEFGGDGESVGELSLQRLRYAAHLLRASGRPLLVTGGRLRHGSAPIAQRMADVLERELGVTVTWVEGQSRTTWENAEQTRALLEPLGHDRIALITHAWHMPRAAAAFRRVGFDVVPAPTVFQGPVRAEPTELLPSAQALFQTSLAWHEWLGRAWYALAHR